MGGIESKRDWKIEGREDANQCCTETKRSRKGLQERATNPPFILAKC